MEEDGDDLQALLTEREAELRVAAEMGQTLLQENQSLKSELEGARAEAESLALKLDATEQYLDETQVELEVRARARPPPAARARSDALRCGVRRRRLQRRR